MTPPLGLTRESGKRWKAPHLEVLENQGLIRVGGTLCSSGDGGSLDGFWRRLPEPSWSWVEFLTFLCREYCAFCPAKPSGSSQAERTRGHLFAIRRPGVTVDMGIQEEDRVALRRGCRSRPATTSAWRPAGSWGPRLWVLFSPPYSLGAAGAPSWKSEQGGRISEGARGHLGPE